MKKSLILMLLLLAGTVSMTAQDVTMDHPTVMKVTGKVVNVGKITSTGAIDLQKTAGSEGKIVNQGQDSEIYTNGLIVGAETSIENEGLLCVDCVPGANLASAYALGELAAGTYDAATGLVTVTGKLKFANQNLGANAVSDINTYLTTSPGDNTNPAIYGALYQWGRSTDGHQLRTSPTSPTLAADPENTANNGDFIIPASEPFDWTSTPNDALWTGKDAVNNPCKSLGSNFRVPTQAEWASIIAGGSGDTAPFFTPSTGTAIYLGVNKWQWVNANTTPSSATAGYLIYPPKITTGDFQNDAADAYDTTPTIFFPASGIRSNILNTLFAGILCTYWSGTAAGYDAGVWTASVYAVSDVTTRANRYAGASVRCLSE